MKHISYILALGISFVCNAQTTIKQISQHDLENLAIINNHANAASLEVALNGCCTPSGKDYFRCSLTKLVVDQTVIEQRQEHLTGLAHTPDTVAAVRDALRISVTCQPTITNKLLLEEFYFKFKQLTGFNTSAPALTASFLLHYATLFFPIVEDALAHAGIGLVLGHHHDGHHHDHHHHHDTCTHNHALEYLAHAGLIGLHLPTYYEMVQHITTRAQKISHAQAEIARIQCYVQQAELIYHALNKEHAAFMRAHTPLLVLLFEHGHPASTLVKTILNGSWNSTAQNLLHPGAILATYAQTDAHADLFQQLVQELGVIDAFTHVATLCTEKPYCLVTFVDQEIPCLHAQGLWHHAIDADAMRTIEVNLSHANACTIITGTNGAGKSTYITAVGQAVVLAQTWGIAPAKSMQMTPFTQIYTHREKHDAIKRGLSHFYCEHEYYQTMLATLQDHKSLVLLDEPYTCTNPQAGANHLTQLIERLQASPLTLSLITTHYPSLDIGTHITL